MDQEQHSPRSTLPLAVIVAGVLVAGALLYESPPAPGTTVRPSDGVVLGVYWGDMTEKLIEEGVIDGEKWDRIYPEKHVITDRKGRLVLTRENAGYLLNTLWALGLGNKNRVLEEGPMTDPQYGGAGRFASTGGWTVSRGSAMNHYSMHDFVPLTDAEQVMVERVAKGIYRPCCSNSAYFPDCNHGMAMLGLIELLASRGMEEEEVASAAHLVNSYWFPEYYEEKNNNNTSSGCSVS